MRLPVAPVPLASQPLPSRCGNLRNYALFALALIASASMPGARAGSTSQSTSTVVSSIILNVVICSVEVVAFLVLRRIFPVIYAPKTFLGPEEQQTPAQSPSLFGWFMDVVKWDKYDILRKQGLDAFMFLEYLELMIICFLPAFFLGYVVLMPNYAVGYDDPSKFAGFEKFTLNHHAPTKHGSLRLIAPLIIQYIVVIWMLYWIRHKVANFVKLRQEFLVSPQHAHITQARTVLITGIPNNLLSESRLTKMYNHLPGGVVKVWINHKTGELPELQKKRSAVQDKYEGAVAGAIKKAFKKIKKGKVEGVELSGTDANGTDVPLDVIDRYLEEKERPHHKLGKFGLFGEKVDTLNWCRDELARLNQEIAEKRAEVPVDRDTYTPQNSAFILFHQQLAAHIAVSQQAYHLPYRMIGRYSDMAPENVIWSNLTMNPYERKVRSALFWAATIALCLFWCIPVGFTGIVSNVQGLSGKVHWLGWLNHIGVVTGIIQGLGPTILLAVLNMLLPPTLRAFARLSGIPITTEVELSLMDRFFLFQILQNFLLMTIVSGSASNITQFAESITKNPTEFPNIIAAAIPKASNFFLSYLLLQGLTGFGSGILQIVPLIVFYVKKFLLGSTPRKIWHIEHDMGAPAWGTLFPVTSLITIIGIGYWIIAPISAGFVFVTFCLLWLLYKYNALYVWDCKPSTETSGLFFPKAINQIFVALYLELVMIAALFFLSQHNETDANGKTSSHQSAIPQGALTVVLIVGVVAFHIILNDSFKPLYRSLALSLVQDDDSSSVPLKKGLSGATVHDETQQAFLPATNQMQAPTEKYMDASSSGPERSSSTSNPDKVVDPEADLDTFDNPAVTTKQRTLWFPNDAYGIGSSEVGNAHAKDLKATNAGTAYTNWKKKTIVTAFAHEPPGEKLK